LTFPLSLFTLRDYWRVLFNQPEKPSSNIALSQSINPAKVYPATLWKWFYDLQSSVIVEKKPDYALFICLKAASNTVMVVL